MKKFEVAVEILGWPLSAKAVQLDEGWDVSVTGGSRTHVGAVSLAQEGQDTQTVLRQGHRDDIVSRQWAEQLAAAWKSPVCVRAGIHYDGITKEEIHMVLDAAAELLVRVIDKEQEELS